MVNIFIELSFMIELFFYLSIYLFLHFIHITCDIVIQNQNKM